MIVARSAPRFYNLPTGHRLKNCNLRQSTTEPSYRPRAVTRYRTVIDACRLNAEKVVMPEMPTTCHQEHAQVGVHRDAGRRQRQRGHNANDAGTLK